MPLYFAYGSNMDQTAMRTRCPRARVLGVAWLPHHRVVLMGNGYASVRPARDAEVHGVLYDLAPSDIAPLDRYEDVAGGLYVKATLSVIRAGGSTDRALVYLGTDVSTGGVAATGYMEGVVAAARAIALPDAYVAGLRDMVPVLRRASAREPS